MIEPSRSGDDTSLLLRGESKVEIQGQETSEWKERDARRWTQEALKQGLFIEDRKHQNWGRRWRAGLRILQDGQGEAPGGAPSPRFKPEPCGETRVMTAVPGLPWRRVIPRRWKCHWLWNWQRWANLCPSFASEEESGGKTRVWEGEGSIVKPFVSWWWPWISKTEQRKMIFIHSPNSLRTLVLILGA